MDFESAVVLRNDYIRDQLRQQTSPKRLISAPYLYCSFAASIILIGVGTYVTSYAYLQEEESVTNKSLKYVGPILVGCGGVTLLSMCIICMVAFRLNQDYFPYDEMDEPAVIGESRFYDDLILPDRRNFTNPVEIHNDGMYEDGIRFLESTVASERQRKISSKSTLPRVTQQDFTNNADVLHHPNQRNPSFKYLGLDSIHRTEPIEDFSVYQNNDGVAVQIPPYARSRSMSMSQPNKQEALHRNLSLNPAQARVHRMVQRQKIGLQRQLTKKRESAYPPELQNISQPKEKTPSSPFLSLRRNKNKDEPIPVCPLPCYDPELIHNIVGKAEQNSFHESKSVPMFHQEESEGSHITDPTFTNQAQSPDAPTLEKSQTSSLKRRSRRSKEMIRTSSTKEKRRRKKRKTKPLRPDVNGSSGCTISSSDEDIKHEISNKDTLSDTQISDELPAMPPPTPEQALSLIQNIIIPVDSVADTSECTEPKRLSVITETGQEDEKVCPSSID